MDKKFLIVLVALVLSVTCTIGVTLAWLVAESDEVVNTFTVGNIAIDLNETDVDTDDNTKANSYKVVPGATVEKDPTVTVEANSENCWVYVKVVNNLAIDGVNVVSYNINDAWEVIETVNNAGVITTLYRHKEIVELSSSAQELDPVFEEVTYSTGIVLEKISQLNEKEIVVTAYAHQSDTVAEADVNAAALAWAGLATVNG